MPLLAIIDEATFTALADETVLGKDSFIKDEKNNNFHLAMDGAEAGKLAIPLQNELKKAKENNAKLLDEKIKVLERVKPWEDLGKTPEEIGTILKDGVTADTEKLTKEYNAKIEGLRVENQRLLDAAKAETDAAAAAKAETERHLISTIKGKELADLTNEFKITKGGEDFFANRISVVFDEDLKKYAPRVIENGEVSYKGPAFKTPAQLAEETKANKDYANLFEAGSAAGSGADARQTSTGSKNGFVNASDSNALAANIEGLATGAVKAV